MSTTQPSTQPIKIEELNDLKRELYKCYKCNCDTFPICICIGNTSELCNECFDIENFNHKLPCKSSPGKFQISSTLTNESKIASTPDSGKSSRTSTSTPLGSSTVKNPSINVINMPRDGDCLYKAFSTAFNNGVSVENLRFLVSKKQSIESFKSYKTLADWKMSEYSAIKGAKTLREFKNVIQYPGYKVGPEHCVWGDENTMRIISNAFRLGILIFNEKNVLVQTIVPEFNNQTKRYILLRLNTMYPGNEHYDLLIFNRHPLINYFELSNLKEILNRR